MTASLRQLEETLVHQYRRVQRHRATGAPEAAADETLQRIVHQREQAIGGGSIPSACTPQQLRKLVHARASIARLIFRMTYRSRANTPALLFSLTSGSSSIARRCRSVAGNPLLRGFEHSVRHVTAAQQFVLRPFSPWLGSGRIRAPAGTG